MKNCCILFLGIQQFSFVFRLIQNVQYIDIFVDVKNQTVNQITENIVGVKKNAVRQQKIFL